MISFIPMKRYLYLPVILLFISAEVNAQNVINTDRPDQSDGTHILEKKHWQIETGLQFSRFDEFTKGFDNTTLIRYGVTKRFEIRLLNQFSMVVDSNKVSGFQSPTISFKNHLCKQKGLLPKITFVSYFRLPVTFSSAFAADHFGYTFTLAARHDITSKMKLYSNFGITQDQQTTDISYLATAEINYNVTESFSAYIEYFGNYAHLVNANNGMDIGFIYAFKKNMAVDVALGSPTLNLGVNKFISFGVSVRLPD